MNRRQFLAGVGSAGIGVTGFRGVQTSRNSNATVQQADEFGTVVDAQQAGADPTGAETANFLFEEVIGDDTLLVFPQGTYLFDPVTLFGQSQVGIASAAGERATFVPTDGDCLGGHPYFEFDKITDLTVEEIDFDFNGVDAGGALHMYLEGDSRVRNTSVLGSCSNQLSAVRIEVRDPDGTATVNMAVENTEDNQSLTGIYVGDDHAGELTFENCRVDGFSDNGLYASAPGGPAGRDGRVDVLGGTYRNNNIANVRLGSTASRAENVTVRVDAPVNGWQRTDARGIRLRNQHSQVLEDCQIEITDGASDSTGAITFHPANLGARVRDTDVRVDRDEVPAVNTFPASGETTAGPILEGLRVSGTAGAGVTAHIEGRDGTVFRDCVIDQTAGSRDGLYFSDSADCLLEDSRIETAGVPVRLENASVTVRNTTLVTPTGESYIEERDVRNELLRPARSSPGRSVESYASDRRVNTAALQEAVGDWRAGDIDTDLLQTVLSAWRNS